ncbi:MAG: SpoIIIAH-like family protein [Ruminococcaceae bacterium]|nr:SpoIIIAH-like family protein [Oscillospiraceae bacterium]
MKLRELVTNVKRKKQGEPKKRMVILHRKQMTALALMLLIGIAGYLNWNFQQGSVDPDVTAVYSEVSKKIGEAQMVSTSEPPQTDVEETEPESRTTAAGSDYFSQAKLERDVKRSEAMDMLTKILDAQNTDKAARKEAEDEIHRLVDYAEKEVMIENLIRAKKYGDTVVFMGENLISIAVQSQGLNEVDAAVLRDAAISTTGYSAENIKIVEIE